MRFDVRFGEGGAGGKSRRLKKWGGEERVFEERVFEEMVFEEMVFEGQVFFIGHLAKAGV